MVHSAQVDVSCGSVRELSFFLPVLAEFFAVDAIMKNIGQVLSEFRVHDREPPWFVLDRPVAWGV